MNAVNIKGLTKNYGKNEVLKHIDLEVPEGVIYGLIGPNGAGKTTLIKALVGALKPTQGSVEVFGLEPIKNRWELRKKIGYMPQSPALYTDISARRNITFFGRAQKIINLEEKVQKILEFTELENRADEPVRTFSGGMQKRVSLACALIHEPKILFLDEPTAAVDPHLKQRSWQLFRSLAKTGVTLFISTHLMDEAMLCDKITILKDGEMLAVNTPENILSMGKTRIELIRNGERLKTEISSKPADLLSELKKFGLDRSIENIKINSDNIEDVVLSIINNKK